MLTLRILPCSCQPLFGIFGKAGNVRGEKRENGNAFERRAAH
jgi:hypothetical protein